MHIKKHNVADEKMLDQEFVEERKRLSEFGQWRFEKVRFPTARSCGVDIFNLLDPIEYNPSKGSVLAIAIPPPDRIICSMLVFRFVNGLGNTL